MNRERVKMDELDWLLPSEGPLSNSWIAKIVGQTDSGAYLWNACKYTNGEWITGHANSPTRERTEAEALAAKLNAAARKESA